jgi:lipopolysaccharide/colanic/teichoic acid biosynthesis glycosyltransferase
MRRLLEKERMRADRSGIPFSVIRIAPLATAPQHDLPAVVRVLRSRLRLTDEIGRLHREFSSELQLREDAPLVRGWGGLLPGRTAAATDLGVLLPDTPGSAALRVAADLRRRFAERGLPQPRMDVFVHPKPTSELPVPDELDSIRPLGGPARLSRAGEERAGSPVRSDSSEGLLLDADAPIADGDAAPVTESGSGTALDSADLFARAQPIWSRLLDVVGATVGLVLFSPVMLSAAAVVRATSHGPAMFSQYREGLGGRRFLILKFRTMYIGAEREQARLRSQSEQDGPAFKMSDDPRVTPVGRWLRKSSIDELPQLFNVLRGDMSLVGPRPLPWEESRACTPWQRRRLDVKPGITCIWQVRGRSRVSFAEWVRMDLEYIRKRSLLYDLWILLQTIPAVLTQKGAS